MSSPKITNRNYFLLLNLLLQETTNNWYSFTIVPKYDTELKNYMGKILDNKGFIKYELPKDKSLFFPLSYKSLTGMHTFNEKIALRNSKYGNLILIDYKEALFIIFQEIFKINKEKFDKGIQNIEELYLEYQQHSFCNFISKKFVTDLSLETSNDIKIISNSVLSKEIFGEYKTLQNLKSLQEIINSFAEKTQLNKSKAAVEWVKTYVDVLLKKVLSLYLDKEILINPTPSCTTLFLNENTLPFEVAFLKETPAVACKEVTTASLSNFKNNFKTQLLTHHIYPLIRCVGLLGLSDEKTLLDTVTDVFYTISKTNKSLDFFENVYTKVQSFLPLIFEIETKYNSKQIHIHNHILNKKYYSNALIKPKPGKVVHKRYFNEGTMEIAIRGFDINTDLKTLYKWVNLEYAKKFWEMNGPIEDLEQEYIKHLDVDYSHPYIGTLNGEPIFTLELYWAVKDIVGKYYPFHPGDYGFHMLIAPAKTRIPNFSYYALTMCMEHFFSHSQVHRMIGEASAEHMGTHNLITKVGCEFNKALVLPYKTSNLTFLTREMYYNTVEDVLKNSTVNKIK